ncbi:MAG: DNA primase noncatalytic subunit PriX [Thaumarchaeota archaeon]|nr:MAG: DNA primase noncatalytic subunit PriX [Nitrososphaerota archaeon]TLX89589.1 MAG: DNA primase noncatalytic subunit PriX [Nitrososphaerota archaeon]
MLTKEKEIQKINSPSDGIEFILNHFTEPIFPRTISTHKSQGKQFEIFSKEEMIKAYEESDLFDCRVNAYPSYTEYKGIQRYPPNFIFADLDLSTFRNLVALDRALQTTLRIIRIKINGTPTVVWTGNGYHIYQPIDAIILEEFTPFEEFENPSLKFLRFAENKLTSGKSDPSHNPSFKSCMIRIPGSYNSKCSSDKNEVKIYQKWDGYRPPISLLLGSFHAYLVDQKIKEMKLKKRIEKRFGNAAQQSNSIHWIETLLQTPIEDYRKNAIGLILTPYLINIRKISYDDAFSIIREWLTKCNELRHLDSNFDYRIKNSLYTAIKKQTLPMRLDTLENKNRELHRLLTEKTKVEGMLK